MPTSGIATTDDKSTSSSCVRLLLNFQRRVTHMNMSLSSRLLQKCITFWVWMKSRQMNLPLTRKRDFYCQTAACRRKMPTSGASLDTDASPSRSWGPSGDPCLGMSVVRSLGPDDQSPGQIQTRPLTKSRLRPECMALFSAIAEPLVLLLTHHIKH